MRYIAVDCGAGSGRVIVGQTADEKITLEEIHRFDNKQLQLGDNLYWDFLNLFNEIKKGIAKAVKKYHDIVSVGVDTWGVDFGLIDERGRLIGNPVCYRDSRTEGVAEQVYKMIGKDDIYGIAGTQPMDLNTIFQLLSMKIDDDPQLKIAKHLLFMPDLINYFLTGEKKNEYTIASTSSLLDAKNKNWSDELLQAVGLQPELMCDIIFPGYVLGKVKKEICEQLGCEQLDVVSIGSHDTASAAAVAYNRKENIAFLSSGTWSLIGTQIKKPILNSNALQHDFTNEGGLGNDILFIKNLTGLWLLQRLVAEWEEVDGNKINYNQVVEEAYNCDSCNEYLHTDDKMFTNPQSMQAAIKNYCLINSIKIPENRNEYVRLVLESLAYKYKQSLEMLENITKKKFEKIHIVGGGSQNELLNQLTSNYTGLPVMAGPVEATAMGNIIMQAIAKKEIKNIDEAGKFIKNSVEMKHYIPQTVVISNQTESVL